MYPVRLRGFTRQRGEAVRKSGDEVRTLIGQQAHRADAGASLPSADDQEPAVGVCGNPHPTTVTTDVCNPSSRRVEWRVHPRSMRLLPLTVHRML